MRVIEAKLNCLINTRALPVQIKPKLMQYLNACRSAIE